MSSQSSAPPSPNAPPAAPIDNQKRRYRKRMCNRSKVDDIINYMDHYHHWNLDAFLHHYATANPLASHSTQSRTAKTRAQKLARLLVKEDVMASYLPRAIAERVPIPDNPSRGQAASADLISIYGLEQELDVLISHDGGHGLFGTIDWGKGDFSVGRLHEAYDLVAELAPKLLFLLQSLHRPRRAREVNYPTRNERDYDSRYAYQVAMICQGRARRASNYLPRTLGVYLYTMGVKKRVLESLHGTGVVESHDAILSSVRELSERAKVDDS